METNAMSHARTRLQGDSTVNNVLNCTIAREASLTTKKCTTEESEASYNWALHLNTVGGEIPEFTGERAEKLQHNFNKEVRETLKFHMTLSGGTI